MKRLLVAICSLAALALLAPVAAAQTSGTYKVVGACGTQTLVAGKMVYPTVDPTGNICTNATGGGGGGGAVTVANGADVTQGSIGDAAWVSGNGTVVSVLKGIFGALGGATPAGTFVIGKVGIDQTTPGTTNAVQLTAGSALVGHTDGAGAQGATATGNPQRTGCRAASATPTAVTDGQLVDEECGLDGKRVFLPYTIKETAVRGSTGATATGTQVSIIASAGGSLRNYITGIQCVNSGASASILTFTDANSLVLINPAGGGVTATFPVPLQTAAATAFQVTFGTASTSQYCSAQGYTGL